MSIDAHENFAYSTVATVPAPADTGTTLTVHVGHGGRFPAAPFNAVVWPATVLPLATNAEIVRVTAISSDALTITRAQEGSTARAITTGDQISAPLTAKTLDDIQTAIAAKADATTTTAALAGKADATATTAALAAKSDVPAITAAANLGATATFALAASGEKWLTGVLTANLILTLTGLAAGARGQLILTPDATGGRTLTVTDGTTSAVVTVNSAASASTVVDAYFDGTDLYLKGA
jgi:hypothetical protein